MRIVNILRSNEGWAPTLFFDYLNLNTVIVRDSYPIRRMDELIDSLGDVKLFTTLDANFVYWKV